MLPPDAFVRAMMLLTKERERTGSFVTTFVDSLAIQVFGEWPARPREVAPFRHLFLYLSFTVGSLSTNIDPPVIKFFSKGKTGLRIVQHLGAVDQIEEVMLTESNLNHLQLPIELVEGAVSIWHRPAFLGTTA